MQQERIQSDTRHQRWLPFSCCDLTQQDKGEGEDRWIAVAAVDLLNYKEAELLNITLKVIKIKIHPIFGNESTYYAKAQ